MAFEIYLLDFRPIVFDREYKLWCAGTDGFMPELVAFCRTWWLISEAAAYVEKGQPMCRNGCRIPELLAYISIECQNE
jgi:hypothetical protein